MGKDPTNDRRQFIKSAILGSMFAGSWSAALATPPVEGERCEPFEDSLEADSDRAFPQGVASGDPRPDGFLLWTRAPAKERAEVDYQVAADEQFKEILRSGKTIAPADSDYTVRVRVEGLEPHRRYWYRFRTKDASSPVGRTRTAPLPENAEPATMAFASCQDYVGRWYHAWRVLADRADEIDFVLFLGDYIYEYERYPELQEPQPGRAIKLPDGLAIDPANGVIAAKTLADYRELYRTINADPDLRRIRRLCPFVILWDDHEHANDAWQDHAADFNDRKGDEKDTDRRMAATRAWFEHLPVDVPYHPEKSYPEDIQTWRTFRWGKRLELAITDERYFRDDHLIPEGPVDLKAGKFLPYSPLGSRTMCPKLAYDAREATKKPTMLGKPQRDWLVRSIQESKATWKVWASALPVSPFVLDLRDQQEAPAAFRQIFYFKTDQWDGFPSERSAILDDLAKVENFVVLSGDLHGFYASELRSNFDDSASPAMGVEFTVAGISSISLVEQIEAISASQKLLKIDAAKAFGGRLDETLKKSSPHFVHANSRGYGVGVARFGADKLEVEFIHVEGVREPKWKGVPQSLKFAVRAGRPKIERLSS